MATTKKSTSKAPTKKAPTKPAKKVAKQPSPTKAKAKSNKAPVKKKKVTKDDVTAVQPDTNSVPNLLTGTTLDEGLKDPRVTRSKKERDPEDVQRHRQIRSALTSKTIAL